MMADATIDELASDQVQKQISTISALVLTRTFTQDKLEKLQQKGTSQFDPLYKTQQEVIATTNNDVSTALDVWKTIRSTISNSVKMADVVGKYECSQQ